MNIAKVLAGRSMLRPCGVQQTCRPEPQRPGSSDGRLDTTILSPGGWLSSRPAILQQEAAAGRLLDRPHDNPGLITRQW
jgi:hypothetical protein